MPRNSSAKICEAVLDRSSDVAAFFGDSSRYVEQNHNIWIRRDIVSEILGDQSYARCLDVGCGDGQIASVAAKRATELTLVDISPVMLDEASKTLQKSGHTNTRLICGDIESVPLEKGRYDLILALGLLAHVRSPREALCKIAEALSPSGIAIIQNFNAQHPLAKCLMCYAWLRTQLGLNPYFWNSIAEREFLGWTDQVGMTLQGRFSYCLPFPGVRRLLSADRLYRLTRSLFGSFEQARLQTLGFEVIYKFQRKP